MRILLRDYREEMAAENEKEVSEQEVTQYDRQVLNLFC